MALDLATIWAGLIAFAVLAYVVLDGFDLGVGILFPTLRGERHRDLAMNTVAPVWDGNETWLILGGGGLFAAFPLAYAVVMPALYTPIIVMLLGLIFRGVAFEYRWRARFRRLWDIAFTAGSVAAAFAQGITLGALVQGIDVADRAYAGGNWDWLSPFSVLVGIALVIGYALLGATWLVLKTEGYVRDRMRHTAFGTGATMLALIGAVSLATPFLDPVYWERWFSGPSLVFSLLVPALVAGAAAVLFRGLAAGDDVRPFFAAQALFVLCYVGIGISFYPYIVPQALTIEQAAAPASSLGFILVGAAILLPLILGYTAYAYWVFRGKTDPESGYH